MKDLQEVLKLYGAKFNPDIFDGCEPNGEVVDLRDVAFMLADVPERREARVRMLYFN